MLQGRIKAELFFDMHCEDNYPLATHPVSRVQCYVQLWHSLIPAQCSRHQTSSAKVLNGVLTLTPPFSKNLAFFFLWFWGHLWLEEGRLWHPPITGYLAAIKKNVRCLLTGGARVQVSRCDTRTTALYGDEWKPEFYKTLHPIHRGHTSLVWDYF